MPAICPDRTAACADVSQISCSLCGLHLDCRAGGSAGSILPPHAAGIGVKEQQAQQQQQGHEQQQGRRAGANAAWGMLCYYVIIRLPVIIPNCQQCSDCTRAPLGVSQSRNICVGWCPW